MKGINKDSEKLIERRLRELVAAKFPGMTVTVGTHPRWNRTAAMFVWKGFEGLLPEERFQRLSSVIPSEMRDETMAGFIWLELAPVESVDDLLKLPRSEDISSRQEKILATLNSNGLLNALSKSSAGAANCGGDFQQTMSALLMLKFSDAAIRDAKLVFIGQGVYCDCQVLEFLQKSEAPKAGRSGRAVS